MEKPRLLQGFRDYLPDQMRARQHVIDTVRRVYESYGFEPLDTPALEYAELLTGKYGEDEKLIYSFKDHGGRDVAMRYDLTVPLARVAASYQNLPKPFKRYQVGPVWRADSPQAGRYREFWQFDVDTVGASSSLADAEMLQIMVACAGALDLPKFRIKVNHRGVLSAILQNLKVSPGNNALVLRALDKLDKIGRAKVELQLGAVMSPEATGQLFAFVGTEKTSDELLNDVRSLLRDEAGLTALENFSDILQLAQSVSEFIQIDLALARGLDYYTGIIYEASLEGTSVGTIYAGGRYDSLIQGLSGIDLPAVGTSLGVDRLLAALENNATTGPSAVLVAVFPGLEQEAFSLAEDLRSHGLNVALGISSEKLGKQLQYADAIGASAVVLYGDQEVAKGVVLVRDMDTGKQEEVKREPIAGLVALLEN